MVINLAVTKIWPFRPTTTFKNNHPRWPRAPTFTKPARSCPVQWSPHVKLIAAEAAATRKQRLDGSTISCAQSRDSRGFAFDSSVCAKKTLKPNTSEPDSIILAYFSFKKWRISASKRVLTKVTQKTRWALSCGFAPLRLSFFSAERLRYAFRLRARKWTLARAETTTLASSSACIISFAETGRQRLTSRRQMEATPICTIRVSASLWTSLVDARTSLSAKWITPTPTPTTSVRKYPQTSPSCLDIQW